MYPAESRKDIKWLEDFLSGYRPFSDSDGDKIIAEIRYDPKTNTVEFVAASAKDSDYKPS